MRKRKTNSRPTWTDVKAKLADFDRQSLVSLLHDLYGAGKENQTFLHARFGLGENVLEPYKETIARWLSPDPFRQQDTSVAKAKQAVSSYKKAVGDPAGLAELMVFFCEQGAAFAAEYGSDDEDYLYALPRMFAQALSLASTLPKDSCAKLFARLEKTRDVSHEFGYGVGDDMDNLLAEYADTCNPEEEL